jgi:hypothetical protein
MSIINDYSVKIIAEQRQRDFQAEAANERLARVALGERQVWWRRLRRTFAPAATTSPVTARTGSTASRATRQSTPTSLREHPVSH